MEIPPHNGNSEPPPGGFQPTRWSMVLAASAQSPEALEYFCRAYWSPVYCYLRRKELPTEDAQDRTQDVFGRLTQANALNAVSADRGRFRTFLMACADHEVSRWRAGLAAEKRGGKFTHVPLDPLEAESAVAAETSYSDPTTAYDRSFALAVLNQAMASLEREYRRSAKSQIFTLLRPWLTDPPEYGEITAVAKRLEITDENMRVLWKRLRNRFVRLVLEELEQTVTDPKDAHAELLHLMAAWVVNPEKPGEGS